MSKPSERKNVILIADDESTSRKYLSRILRKDGYEVIEAENGKECLDLSSHIKADMVLLDALMPVMDGFECCRSLRQSPQYQDTPILMITGLDDFESVNQAYEVGATDFLTKPINPAVLCRRLRYLLEVKKAEKALKESEEKYRLLVENLKEVIFYADKEGKLTFLNPAWEELTSLPPESCLGKPLLIYIYPEDQKIYKNYWQSLLQAEENTPPQRCQVRYVKPTGNFGWMRISASPIVTNGEIVGISGTINDITDRKRIEQYQAIERDIIKILAEAETQREGIEKILETLGRNIGAEIADYWELKPGENLVYPQNLWYINEPEILETVKKREEEVKPIPWGRWDINYDEKELDSQKLLCYPNCRKIRLVFLFAVKSGEENIGLMAFYSRRPIEYDYELLKDIAKLGAQIGQFVKRKRAEEELKATNLLLQSELQIASEYVLSLLPSPDKQGIKVEQKFIPCAKLGGDIFDYYWLDEETFVVYLLDVAGHGIHSALLSVSVLNLVRNNSLYNTDPYLPWTILEELNRLFQIDGERPNYFTIWYGVYNVNTRELAYASAGHPPAVLIYKEGQQWQYKTLHTPGLPIGMIEDVQFEERVCQIPPDSFLYIFSDGIYEIPQENGTVFGLTNFLNLLLENHRQHQGNLDRMIEQIKAINKSPNFNDDLSIIKLILD